VKSVSTDVSVQLALSPQIVFQEEEKQSIFDIFSKKELTVNVHFEYEPIRMEW
jgi:hypothetical protein